jgi:hypothetical protein
MKEAKKKPVKKANKTLDECFVPIRTCAICGRDNTQIKRFIKHHLRYRGEFGGDITADLCHVCHERTHGRRIFGHPFEKIYGKDLGPYVFAAKVSALYEDGWRNNGRRGIDDWIWVTDAADERAANYKEVKK